MKILVIEDDQTTAEYISRSLNEAGHVCDVMTDGADALFQITRMSYDVLIVDRMLPGLDGFSLVKAARAAKIKTPVMFLTSANGIDDRAEGLKAGGDDYLTKPFAFHELVARLAALALPPVQDQKSVLKVADLELDLVNRHVERQGVTIELQSHEFMLLEVLMRAEGRTLTRTMILEQVWDFHFVPKTSVVETCINRLRAKIDAPFDVPLLHVVGNTGYCIHEPQ